MHKAYQRFVVLWYWLV